MHSHSPHSFAAWQEAEQRAAAAETQLFARVLAAAPAEMPTRAEVEQARALREAANALLAQMVAHMQEEAAARRATRPRVKVRT